jgi:hypothetical protein
MNHINTIKMIGALVAALFSTLFAVGYTYTHYHNLGHELNFKSRQIHDALPYPTSIFSSLSTGAILIPITLLIVFLWLKSKNRCSDFAATVYVVFAWTFSFGWALCSILVWRLPYVFL